MAVLTFVLLYLVTIVAEVGADEVCIRAPGLQRSSTGLSFELHPRLAGNTSRLRCHSSLLECGVIADRTGYSGSLRDIQNYEIFDDMRVNGPAAVSINYSPNQVWFGTDNFCARVKISYEGSGFGSTDGYHIKCESDPRMWSMAKYDYYKHFYEHIGSFWCLERVLFKTLPYDTNIITNQARIPGCDRNMFALSIYRGIDLENPDEVGSISAIFGVNTGYIFPVCYYMYKDQAAVGVNTTVPPFIRFLVDDTELFYFSADSMWLGGDKDRQLKCTSVYFRTYGSDVTVTYTGTLISGLIVPARVTAFSRPQGREIISVVESSWGSTDSWTQEKACREVSDKTCTYYSMPSPYQATHESGKLNLAVTELFKNPRVDVLWDGVGVMAPHTSWPETNSLTYDVVHTDSGRATAEKILTEQMKDLMQATTTRLSGDLTRVAGELYEYSTLLARIERYKNMGFNVETKTGFWCNPNMECSNPNECITAALLKLNGPDPIDIASSVVSLSEDTSLNFTTVSELSDRNDDILSNSVSLLRSEVIENISISVGKTIEHANEISVNLTANILDLRDRLWVMGNDSDELSVVVRANFSKLDSALDKVRVAAEESVGELEKITISNMTSTTANIIELNQRLDVLANETDEFGVSVSANFSKLDSALDKVRVATEESVGELEKITISNMTSVMSSMSELTDHLGVLETEIKEAIAYLEANTISNMTSTGGVILELHQRLGVLSNESEDLGLAVRANFSKLDSALDYMRMETEEAIAYLEANVTSADEVLFEELTKKVSQQDMTDAIHESVYGIRTETTYNITEAIGDLSTIVWSNITNLSTTTADKFMITTANMNMMDKRLDFIESNFESANGTIDLTQFQVFVYELAANASIWNEISVAKDTELESEISDIREDINKINNTDPTDPTIDAKINILTILGSVGIGVGGLAVIASVWALISSLIPSKPIKFDKYETGNPLLSGSKMML